MGVEVAMSAGGQGVADLGQYLPGQRLPRWAQTFPLLSNGLEKLLPKQRDGGSNPSRRADQPSDLGKHLGLWLLPDSPAVPAGSHHWLAWHPRKTTPYLRKRGQAVPAPGSYSAPAADNWITSYVDAETPTAMLVNAGQAGCLALPRAPRRGDQH